MKKVKRAVQWIISVSMIVGMVGNYSDFGMAATLLGTAAGVLLLPPVTKRLPRFRYRNIILLVGSMLVWYGAMTMGNDNIPDGVKQQREAKAASIRAQEAAESEAAAASAEAERAAQEKAESEAAAASQSEKDQEKIEEYKTLILRNYADPNGASKSDQSKFLGIADKEDELKLFTRAWRETLYETFMADDPIPSDTSHGTYMKMVDVFNGFVHLYSYYYSRNAEGGVEKWIPYEYDLYRNTIVGSASYDKAFNDTYKGFIEPQILYPEVSRDTFYISQKLSNSTGNSVLDALNDAFSDGSSEWVGYKGGFFSANDDACVLVTAKGMSFSESGDYTLIYVNSGKTTTLTDSRGFEQEADIYYAYDPDEFSEAYENLNTVDNEIADESGQIFEFLIGNENYTDWQ